MKRSISLKTYRQGVVAIIINDQNQVLIGERSDHPGAWQFPQGGVEDQESVQDAFFREVLEELGNNRCEILKVGAIKTRYEWPEPGRKYVGQEHTWFLARYLPGEYPDLTKSDQCFSSWKWESPERALDTMVGWKKPAMEAGLRILGLL